MQESTVIISGEPVLADNWENIELGYHRENSEDNDAGKLEKKTVYVMHILSKRSWKNSGLWFRTSGLNFVCNMICDDVSFNTDIQTN